MNCPVCGGETIVKQSFSDCESVRRRRACVDCGYRFGTVEYEECYVDGKKGEEDLDNG